MSDTALARMRESYPVDWCFVSGDKLGSDGPIIDRVHEGRLIRFCCKNCVGEFNKNPGKFLAMLDRAANGETVQPPAGSGNSRKPSGGGHDHGAHGH